MKVGDKYYYTGDMANIEDFGTITAIYTNKWGNFIDGKLDDGRVQKRLFISCFNKGCGQRFKLLENIPKSMV